MKPPLTAIRTFSALMEIICPGKCSAEHFPGQIISINAENVRIAVKGGFIEVSRFKSDQGKLYVKDMNTAVFTEGDLFS